MKPRLATTTVPAARTLRFATPLLALMVALAGCSSLDGLTSGDKVDYRTRAAKTEPLDVPPDLTQLARDGRYQPQSGVVSASTLKQGGGVGGGIAAAPAAAVVAPTALADMRIERQGNSRWLVSGLPPETLYPLLRGFWLERGFTLAEDNPQIGVMETSWAENRAKIPMDIVRSTLGRVFDNLYSTSERDRFRTRIERTATGSEVYISHRGMQEIYTDQRREQTIWQPRPTDPGLEAEFLSRLMVKLGAKDDSARATVAAATPAPAKARAATATTSAATSATMELDEGFERAWRQVGLALDRSGFTVEDRDRTQGVYFVRYIDPKFAGKDEPNLFAKLFSFMGKKVETGGPARYRVTVKSEGEISTVSVLNGAGAPENGDAGKRITTLLLEDLK